eukprot:451542_1
MNDEDSSDESDDDIVLDQSLAATTTQPPPPSQAQQSTTKHDAQPLQSDTSHTKQTVTQQSKPTIVTIAPPTLKSNKPNAASNMDAEDTNPSTMNQQTSDALTEKPWNDKSKGDKKEDSKTDDDAIGMLICNAESNTNDCRYLKRLCGILNHHQTCATDINGSDSQTLIALNCFLHLLDEHDDDDDFQAIVHVMDCCDIVSCNAYRRNTRDRDTRCIPNNNHSNVPSTARADILDKIHCYYMHSYDTGHRLTTKQKTELKNMADGKDNEEDEIDFTNTKFLRLKRTLRRDRSDKFTNVVRNANNIYREKIKCNQIVPIAIEEDKEDSNHNEYKMYSFGEKLRFGYRDEYDPDDPIHGHIFTVTPTYDSLKGELLSNNVAMLTAPQFNCEYQK